MTQAARGLALLAAVEQALPGDGLAEGAVAQLRPLLGELRRWLPGALGEAATAADRQLVLEHLDSLEDLITTLAVQAAMREARDGR